MTTHPECDKMIAVHEDSQKLGEFIEWLGSDEGGGLFIAEWDRQVECGWHTPFYSRGQRKFRECVDGVIVDSDREPQGQCDMCSGTGFVDRIEPRGMPHHESIERLLARYFNIDLAEVERERRAILDGLRAGA